MTLIDFATRHQKAISKPRQEKNTWFWHSRSPNYIHGGKDPDGVSPSPFEDLCRKVFRVLLPDEKINVSSPKKPSGRRYPVYKQQRKIY